MVSLQDHCADTEAYRPPGFCHPNIQNRTKFRLVMQLYGKSIEHFTSRAQATSALRDAILASRSFFERYLTPRGLSMQNILLGHFGASPRLRGILIDLDMAIWTTSDISKLRANMGLGTRQSIGVLHNLQCQLPPRHDHLDDLESFFYVLCHLVLLFESPGCRSKAMNDMFAEWETVESLHTLVVLKSAKLYDYCQWPTSLWWGEVAETLLKGFQDILWPIVQRKTTAR
ncbi:hypothetical protein D9611_005954 [Ephemerocybe angulata]|uniref:Fungal-type protein kinase domain-containing protein n=1 Tax=Ephemerocybe angulata TaxID=980116 RepID=A0A8H5CG33_9AGAR|nr:hypothetical protein D9611_005954 [Tulosesus angulatus]